MGALDLNRVAICMGKVLKLLPDVEKKCSTRQNLYNNKEDLLVLAYICRIGILDRMEETAYLTNPNLRVVIPTGLFSVRRETMSSGLMLTIGKIKSIASLDSEISEMVENVLEKGTCFYDLDAVLPGELKKQI